MIDKVSHLLAYKETRGHTVDGEEVIRRIKDEIKANDLEAMKQTGKKPRKKETQMTSTTNQSAQLNISNEGYASSYKKKIAKVKRRGDFEQYIKNYEELKKEIEKSGGKDAEKKLKLLDDAFEEAMKEEAAKSGKEVSAFLKTYDLNDKFEFDSNNYKDVFLEIAMKMKEMGISSDTEQMNDKISKLLGKNSLGSYEDFRLVTDISAMASDYNDNVSKVTNTVLGADYKLISGMRSEYDSLMNKINKYFEETPEFQSFVGRIKDSTLSDELKDLFNNGLTELEKMSNDVGGKISKFKSNLDTYILKYNDMMRLEARLEKYEEQLEEAKEKDDLETVSRMLEKMVEVNEKIALTRTEKDKSERGIIENQSGLRIYNKSSKEYLENLREKDGEEEESLID